MKSLSVFLDEKVQPKAKKQNPPSVLILKRKYIRQFPGVGQVALYFSPQLKKHITVPFSDIQFDSDINEETLFLTEEDNLSLLEKIVDSKKSQNVTFSDGTDFIVDPGTASNILSVYARADAGNKSAIKEMLSTDIQEFQKLVKFCLENS